MQKQTNKKEKSSHKKSSFLFRITYLLVSLSILFYIIIIGKELLVPLVIGFFTSIILVPFSRFQEIKLKIPRVIASFISSTLFMLSISGVLYFLGSQLVYLQQDLPEFNNQVLNLIKEIQSYVFDKFGITQQEQIHFISENAEKAFKESSSLFKTTLTSILSMLSSSVFVFLYTFFFLMYRKHLKKFLIWSFIPKYEGQVNRMVLETQTVIRQYTGGLIIQVLFVFSMIFIAYSFIGIKYALLFAVLSGVLNLIPYIGIISVTLLAAAITIVTGQPIDVLWVFVISIFVHTIDANIIMPKVIGSKVSLNPFVVFLGIVISQTVWGIAGMFLAIPILAILKIIFDYVLDLRPYGFLLAESKERTPIFDENYMSFKTNPTPENQEVKEQEAKKDS